MTQWRAGSQDSEDPPRIYNHPQHRWIVLTTSTQKSHPAGESEIHEWAEIETLPSHTNCCVQMDEILVGSLESYLLGKEGLLARA